MDTTVKVLYGKQEGAVVGYNPKKPGRTSHTYHNLVAGLRLVLDADVLAGNDSHSNHTLPGLVRLLVWGPRLWQTPHKAAMLPSPDFAEVQIIDNLLIASFFCGMNWEWVYTRLPIEAWLEECPTISSINSSGMDASASLVRTVCLNE